MTSDSGLFHTRGQLEREGWTLEGNVFRRGSETMLPLYEAKMIHHYDHRWATYTYDESGDVRDVTDAEHSDPNFVVMPRYWVPEHEVTDRLEGRWTRKWLLGFRDICRSTDERTMIADLFPTYAVGNKVPVLLADITGDYWCLAATLASLAVDFAARQKLGGITMNFFYVEQHPIPSPMAFKSDCSWDLSGSLSRWIEERVAELIYTSWDMEPAATDLHLKGTPYIWDPERRAMLRAELDAAFFHLYGIDGADAEYILSTFPIALRRDPGLAGRVIREYDKMALAVESGVPFRSSLDPPPGYGPRHRASQ